MKSVMNMMSNIFTIFIFFMLYLLQCDGYILNSTHLEYKIVGGQNASITDYPYQVSIAYNNQHFCGGSILNSLYILTAAHCTYDIDTTYLNFLSVRVNSSYVNRGGTVYNVLKIHVHPDFNDVTYDFDISILLVNNIITYGIGVWPIALPSKGTNIGDGQEAVATGWGQTSNNDANPSDQLQVVTLPVLSTNTCSRYYPAGYVSENMFCAGYDEGGKDTCQGDSGGPLVISGIQIGITSWGTNKCAAPKQPGAFTKLPLFIDYINSIINN